MVNMTYKLSDGSILETFGDHLAECDQIAAAALEEINNHERRRQGADPLEITARWEPQEIPKRWVRYGVAVGDRRRGGKAG